MTRSTVKVLLKYAVGFGILVAVAVYNWDGKDGQPGLSVVLDPDRPRHFGMLALSVVVCAIGTAITFYRWYVLVAAQELSVSPRDVVRLSLIGYFFNTFLPGSIGGDLVKSAFLVREQSRRTLAVATVVLDRIIGLAGLFWLVAILGGSLYLSGASDESLANEKAGQTLTRILTFSAAIVAGTLVGWLVLGWLSSAWLDLLQERLDGHSKIGHSLAEVVRAVRVYREKGWSVAGALALSMVGHFCFVLSFYCGARIFSNADEIPPLMTQFAIVPMGMVIRGVIPLPGGIGGAEIGYGMLYEWVGAPFVAGVLASIAEFVVKWILGLVALVLYQMMDKKRATPEVESDE